MQNINQSAHQNCLSLTLSGMGCDLGRWLDHIWGTGCWKDTLTLGSHPSEDFPQHLTTTTQIPRAMGNGQLIRLIPSQMPMTALAHRQHGTAACSRLPPLSGIQFIRTQALGDRLRRKEQGRDSTESFLIVMGLEPDSLSYQLNSRKEQLRFLLHKKRVCFLYTPRAVAFQVDPQKAVHSL